MPSLKAAVQLDYFAGMIEKETGIRFSDGTYYQLEARLEELASKFGYKAGIEELYHTILDNQDPALKKLIFEKATNNETYFFRDPKLFNALETRFIPELKEKFGAPIRIWSTACSSGQESYSISILLQKLGIPAAGFDYLCSDINEAILERARTGKYSQLEVQRGLSTPDLIRYFRKSTVDSSWEVVSSLKDSLRFARINLLEAWPHKKKFHLILCRNVLIYQSIENRRQIMRRLVDALEPGGYLAMGAGESLVGISAEIVQVEHNGAILYRKKS
ncbi:MAG: protein-glutamate O-methyltransferase CheR [Bdellovibrionales bacterium]|nr:protein-glutamate O-methyltransferase CheR [Bdellovibrionales bacterium]